MKISNIPACLQMLTVALIGSALFLPALVRADDHTDWREKMKLISSRGYVCRHTTATIKVAVIERTRRPGNGRRGAAAGFVVRPIPPKEILNLTKIDRWFLEQIKEIVDFEEELAGTKN